jgi:hypothetical protein
MRSHVEMPPATFATSVQPEASRWPTTFAERLPEAQITSTGRSFGTSNRRAPSCDIGMSRLPSMRERVYSSSSRTSRITAGRTGSRRRMSA